MGSSRAMSPPARGLSRHLCGRHARGRKVPALWGSWGWARGRCGPSSLVGVKTERGEDGAQQQLYSGRWERLASWGRRGGGGQPAKRLYRVRVRRTPGGTRGPGRGEVPSRPRKDGCGSADGSLCDFQGVFPLGHAGDCVGTVCVTEHNCLGHRRVRKG